MHKALKSLLFDQIQKTGRCFVRVGGYCMTPKIRDGAGLVIEKAKNGSLSPGQIAAYYIEDKLFVHRVIGFNGSALNFRADGPNSVPHTIDFHQVLGRVSKITNPGFFKRIEKKVKRFWTKN